MAKKQIAVIGANQTGLTFSYFAVKHGFDVTVYEAKNADEVAYDWTDDMAPDTFDELGLPLPPPEVYTRKRSWTFVPPKKDAFIYVELPQQELDLAVYRRPFNSWLRSLACDAGVTVNYGTRVEKLNISRNRATGVTLTDGSVRDADLVVDCGGVDSSVRRSLPGSFGIQQEIRPEDTFCVRRTFFERPEGTERPEYTNKAYLKHMNENGISWCLLSYNEKAADVLIGRVGEMSDETYQNALDDLRKDNEIIGDKVIKGGELLRIPVRHPLSRMVADGYALVGDSACMTIPMLGSGMASGMRAAKMLADIISEPAADPFCKNNLYRYQLSFMKELGARHAAIDLMKNWLLSSGEGELDFLLSNGVVSKNVLKQGSAGEMVKMSPADLMNAGVKGVVKPQLMLELVALLAKMNVQCRLAADMPETYDEQKLWYWERKYEAAYK